MIARMYMACALFALLLIELFCAGIGLMVPLTVVGVLYFSLKPETPSVFFPAVLTGFTLDIALGRAFPWTAIMYALFVFFLMRTTFFGRRTDWKMSYPVSILTFCTLVPVLFFNAPGALLNLVHVRTALAMIVFGVGINVLLFGFVFIALDYFSRCLGLKTAQDEPPDTMPSLWRPRL